jgi:hypothetical protein
LKSREKIFHEKRDHDFWQVYDIELTKDEKGLGITVAGYVCEKGDENSVQNYPIQNSRIQNY